jgi:hypothetical protein
MWILIMVLLTFSVLVGIGIGVAYQEYRHRCPRPVCYVCQLLREASWNSGVSRDRIQRRQRGMGD